MVAGPLDAVVREGDEVRVLVPRDLDVISEVEGAEKKEGRVEEDWSGGGKSREEGRKRRLVGE